ncbi:hypothetical protein DFJ73DRAFT_964285, partial [Zopfochytrium polystomum]
MSQSNSRRSGGAGSGGDRYRPSPSAGRHTDNGINHHHHHHHHHNHRTVVDTYRPKAAGSASSNASQRAQPAASSRSSGRHAGRFREDDDDDEDDHGYDDDDDDGGGGGGGGGNPAQQDFGRQGDRGWPAGADHDDGDNGDGGGDAGYGVDAWRRGVVGSPAFSAGGGSEWSDVGAGGGSGSSGMGRGSRRQRRRQRQQTADRHFHQHQHRPAPPAGRVTGAEEWLDPPRGAASAAAAAAERGDGGVWSSTGSQIIHGLRVSGLHSSITQAEIEELFSRFSGVKSVRLEMDRDGRCAGHANVLFTIKSQADDAYLFCAGLTIDGIPIQVQFYEQPIVTPPPPPPP